MRVVSNTAISLDGRIATARFDHVAIGSRLDRDHMSVLRARADAVVVGGRTFRNWPLPLVPDDEAIARAQAAGLDADVPPLAGRRWWNAVVTRGGAPVVAPRFFADARVQPLFYSAAPLEVARGEVVEGAFSPVAVIQDLARRGAEHVLLECGGELLFQFLAAGCVDELCVTVCPLLLGGKGAPSLLDGEGFSFDGAPRLTLLDLRQIGGELFARYSVERTADGQGT